MQLEDEIVANVPREFTVDGIVHHFVRGNNVKYVVLWYYYTTD